MDYEIRKFDTNLERRIVIGMIVSAEFLSEAVGMFRPDLFRVPALKTIAKWCIRYWGEYGKNPGMHIQDIYESKRRTNEVSDEQESEIEAVLSNLSNEYISNPNLNHRYLLQQMERLMRSRALLALGEDLVALASTEKVEEAELALAGFKPVAREGISWSDPFNLSDDQIDLIFADGDVLFRFPGAVGELIGPVERDSFIGIQAPEKRGKCESGRSRVLMANGEYLQLSAVVASGRTDIVSLDESTGRFIPTKVADFWDNGIKPVYAIRTKSGRDVEITSNHPLLTVDGWKELSELSVGEFIAVPRETPFFGVLHLNPYMVRMLAYFIADGSLSTGSVGFTKDDSELQEDFTKCVEFFGCRVYWKGIQATVFNSEQNARIHGKNYVKNILESQGLLGKLSYDKYIPDLIYRGDKESVAMFLKTLFSCDGWVSSNGADIGFAVANQYLAKQVHHLLTRFGIVSKLRYKENEHAGAWAVEIRDYDNMKRFLDEIGFMGTKADRALKALEKKTKIKRSFLDRIPWQIAKRFLDSLRAECVQKGIDIYKTYGRRKIEALILQTNKKQPLMWQSFVGMEGSASFKKYLNNQVLWDEIVEISYAGEVQTYDLTVEKYHNFVSENIVVHNTWWLWEFALRAVLNRCNVAFFSVGDMSAPQNWRRVHGWVLRSSRKRSGRNTLVPVMDCRLNQLGECRDCPNQDPVMMADGKLLELDEAQDHEPCIRCLKEDPRRFIGSRWYKRERVPDFQPHRAKALLQQLSRRTGGKAIRLQCYPSNQANVRTIRTMLDLWEKQDGWVADVVVIDYADILAPEDAREVETRHRINATWAALRGLSTERSIAVITATQAAKTSYNKSNQDMGDVSEDKRKLGHVTSMLALNQAPGEKKMGLMRVNQLVVREDDFDSRDNVVCLQCLAMSRPLLGSYWLK